MQLADTTCYILNLSIFYIKYNIISMLNARSMLKYNIHMDQYFINCQVYQAKSRCPVIWWMTGRIPFYLWRIFMHSWWCDHHMWEKGSWFYPSSKKKKKKRKQPPKNWIHCLIFIFPISGSFWFPPHWVPLLTQSCRLFITLRELYFPIPGETVSQRVGPISEMLIWRSRF